MEKSQGDASNSLVVVKFGGSSLAKGEKVSNAVKAVVKELRRGKRIVVVVSAMGKTTDFLLNVAKEALFDKDLAPNSDVDDILAMGERTSARVLSAALKANGVKCRYFDTANDDWPIITNDKPTNADPILSECEKRIVKHIQPLLREGVVPVLPGFIGKTVDGKITTMGRGGSDVTALVVAHALKARQVILATDVDGIMTADPKLVKSAKKIEEIDVNSLIGLASCGSKFLQKKALKYKDPDIDVKIINHNCCDLEADGTVIKGSLSGRIFDLEFPETVASITVVGKALLQSNEFLNHMIKELKDAGVQLLGISANYDSLIIYVPEKSLDRILEPIHSIILQFSNALAVAFRRGLALLKIKAAGLEETPGVISQFAKALYARNINIYGLFTVASGIHVLVDMSSLEEASAAIKNAIENFEMNCLKLTVPAGGFAKNG
ncbi:MAG: aspartate kinase [Candidatus Bathycorpusculaceae bacterium]